MKFGKKIFVYSFFNLKIQDLEMIVKTQQTQLDDLRAVITRQQRALDRLQSFAERRAPSTQA